MRCKGKGSSFERAICKKLSLWVTDGKQADVFWRTAISGGRATRDPTVRQGGDITSVAPEGHCLTEYCYFELKHYRDLQLPSFLLNGCGVLAKFWTRAVEDAYSRHKIPILIAKQNNYPTLIITPRYNRWPFEPAIIMGTEHAHSFRIVRLDRALNLRFKPRAA